ncbi:hypothetical protein AB9F45_38645, partial [Rhizobium leguminosarum]|uniref:hypothetical protein n=1 Tax=Rhizobium leguminosarum TaxID=384 RepID=UPI003F99273F
LTIYNFGFFQVIRGAGRPARESHEGQGEEMMDVRRANVAGGRLRVDFDGLKAWRDSLSGHETSEPLLRYLPKAELVLKRA